GARRVGTIVESLRLLAFAVLYRMKRRVSAPPFCWNQAVSYSMCERFCGWSLYQNDAAPQWAIMFLALSPARMRKGPALAVMRYVGPVCCVLFVSACWCVFSGGLE
ncbi:hypothetical protein, partial [Bifidobacterium longum]